MQRLKTWHQTEQIEYDTSHLPGYDRDQCMSSHMSNHITIGYGNILEELVATCIHLGIPTRIAGDGKNGLGKSKLEIGGMK